MLLNWWLWIINITQPKVLAIHAIFVNYRCTSNIHIHMCMQWCYIAAYIFTTVTQPWYPSWSGGSMMSDKNSICLASTSRWDSIM